MIKLNQTIYFYHRSQPNNLYKLCPSEEFGPTSLEISWKNHKGDPKAIMKSGSDIIPKQSAMKHFADGVWIQTNPPKQLDKVSR